MVRNIRIDRDRCDGCGLCVNACHEGALAIIDGKAVLVRPNMCDGMGDCLPACPKDAISFGEGPVNIPVNMMAVPGCQWPIQMALVSPAAGFLKGTLVIAADCTAFVTDDFKKRFIRDRPVIIGCPKLDDRSRFDKIGAILKDNDISAVEIYRMEVPCCSALTRIVSEAAASSGRDIMVSETILSKDGKIIRGP